MTHRCWGSFWFIPSDRQRFTFVSVVSVRIELNFPPSNKCSFLPSTLLTLGPDHSLLGTLGGVEHHP